MFWAKKYQKKTDREEPTRMLKHLNFKETLTLKPYGIPYVLTRNDNLLTHIQTRKQAQIALYWLVFS